MIGEYKKKARRTGGGGGSSSGSGALPTHVRDGKAAGARRGRAGGFALGDLLKGKNLVIVVLSVMLVVVLLSGGQRGSNVVRRRRGRNDLDDPESAAARAAGRRRGSDDEDEEAQPMTVDDDGDEQGEGLIAGLVRKLVPRDDEEAATPMRVHRDETLDDVDDDQQEEEEEEEDTRAARRRNARSARTARRRARDADTDDTRREVDEDEQQEEEQQADEQAEEAEEGRATRRRWGSGKQADRFRERRESRTRTARDRTDEVAAASKRAAERRRAEEEAEREARRRADDEAAAARRRAKAEEEAQRRAAEEAEARKRAKRKEEEALRRAEEAERRLREAEEARREAQERQRQAEEAAAAAAAAAAASKGADDYDDNYARARRPYSNYDDDDDDGDDANEGRAYESVPASVQDDGRGPHDDAYFGGRNYVPETRLDAQTAERQDAVKGAFLHAYNSYKRIAWGMDELMPMSGRGHNWIGLGLTILDSLGTMWLMDLKDEFREARDWVANNLSFDKNAEVSFFETTIRCLGGLMSAYDLSGERVFLKKAEGLAHRLSWAFNTTTGLPLSTVNLKTGRGRTFQWAGNSAILSEVGTVQMEFNAVSHATGNQFFAERSNKVFDLLDKLKKEHVGLYPIYINPSTGKFTTKTITFGALGDSFYEYLLKMWMLTGREHDQYLRMYKESMRGLSDVLVRETTPNKFKYVADLKNGQYQDKMDHLVCFIAGTLLMGSQYMDAETRLEHIDLGKEIAKTCYHTYEQEPTGIGPEFSVFRFSPSQDMKGGANHYLLRPETVEAIFYAWRYTHDPIYREWGWNIFQAIEKHCRVPNGYTGIKDVRKVPVQHNDKMESFFLAETLKYLYLLFSEDTKLDMHEWVFNTEAHPLRAWRGWQK